MDENKKADWRLLAMDACRPGHEDWQLPELAEFARELKDRPDLAERFEQIRRCDAQLQAAMQDIEIPPGARERLLQRLQDAGHPTALASASTSPSPSSQSTPAGRSWWPLALAACLLIGASFVVAWTWNTSSPVDVHLTARAFYEQLGGWKNDRNERPSIRLPANLAFRSRGWQPVTFNGLAGVAYDISLPHARGILFVCALPKGLELPTAPPPVSETLYERRSIAVWRSGEQLCMLVVEGGERAYQDLIRAANGPIAWVKNCRFHNFG